MAEWIEILRLRLPLRCTGSPLAMAEWIEIVQCCIKNPEILSPLAMAEWIEIYGVMHRSNILKVSASDGGVD